jgi:PPOX class probable F420-dependent enzyme
MAKQRDLVTMSAAEVESLLASARKVQLGTLNPDGSIHLVTMFYGLAGGQIAFWTYRTSQKALNLARDPRITCLVEDGTDYFELRGVQIRGTVRVVSAPEEVLEIGRLVAGGMADGLDGAVDAYVARAARKRLGYIVEPQRVVSWDHRKLLTGQSLSSWLTGRPVIRPGVSRRADTRIRAKRLSWRRTPYAVISTMPTTMPARKIAPVLSVMIMSDIGNLLSETCR